MLLYNNEATLWKWKLWERNTFLYFILKTGILVSWKNWAVVPVPLRRLHAAEWKTFAHLLVPRLARGRFQLNPPPPQLLMLSLQDHSNSLLLRNMFNFPMTGVDSGYITRLNCICPWNIWRSIWFIIMILMQLETALVVVVVVFVVIVDIAPPPPQPSWFLCLSARGEDWCWWASALGGFQTPRLFQTLRWTGLVRTMILYIRVVDSTAVSLGVFLYPWFWCDFYSSFNN